ncbi:MAG: hypothetical protein HKN54_10565, partial [Flavobacteriaceae bacterium]|nr:hypothetical protein [Flavobacteriaceae bacterium]
IKFDLNMFEAFIGGLKSSGLKLFKEEIDFLPLSAALMPFLHGLRMLTDHLQGNSYYKVSYPDQNLDRCRSLFHFTELALNFKCDIQQFTEHLK